MPPPAPYSKPLSAACKLLTAPLALSQAKQACGLVGAPSLRDLLRFLDNHFALLHSCALEVATRPPAPAASPDEWSPDQQAALQQALKDVPASIEPGERWTRIAGLVPGKTKKECVARFKALKAALAGGGWQQHGAAKAEGAGAGKGEGGARRDACAWSDEQQEALQEGLKQYPQV